jgi:uncharacterized membrane protein YedE/YeeE
MDASQLDQLQLMVLASAGWVSFLFGCILHRTHFCTMGAVSDAVIMGSFDRLRQWALAVAVAVLGFGLMSSAGLISPLKTIYPAQTAPWLSMALGGFLFGWGMVWGSGCGSKSLVRLGSGNLKSLVVLVAMGLAALATLRGFLAIPRVRFIESLLLDVPQGLFTGQWLALLLDSNLQQGMLWSSVAACFLLCVWVFKDRSFISRGNVFAGLSVGLLVCGMWWVSGVLGHGLEHPETLEEFFLATSSRKMEAFSLTAPLAFGLDALLYFSDGSKRLTIGMVSVLGLCLGSFASAKVQGSFRWEGFSNAADLKRHLWGGVLMGVGAVMAMGCSIGQGLSGMSTLNIMSIWATASILLGAFVALQYDLKKAD